MSVLIEFCTHDKLWLELATISHPQRKAFIVDLFWYFPKPLGITKLSYPKPLFYRYLKNNLRYRIPNTG